MVSSEISGLDLSDSILLQIKDIKYKIPSAEKKLDPNVGSLNSSGGDRPRGGRKIYIYQ